MKQVISIFYSLGDWLFTISILTVALYLAIFTIKEIVKVLKG